MSPIRTAALLAMSSLPLTLVTAPSPLSAQPVHQQIEIVLDNFSFAPSDLKVSAGQPVTLHFVNRGSGGHNFIAKDFFAAATMDSATRQKLGKKGVVELAKGEAMYVTLTPKAGSYTVKCGHFMHSTFGMKGTITVS
jgi:plastocyanin